MLPYLARFAPSLLKQEWVDQVVGALLKQAAERLDNLREKAGEALRYLVECDELRKSEGLRALDIFEAIR